MISCLIWPSINSWRHHNGLRTQSFNLHIMTSAYFWKIDCISVNIDRFSSKFWYDLPETILYKGSHHNISFWQRYHGVFLRLKVACQFFTFCVYSLWDMTFSQNWILHPVFCEQYLRLFNFVFVELWVWCSWENKLSQVCPLFFRSDAGIMLIFHLQSGICEFYFPFTCNLYGKCFGISVTHLTSDLEVPGSSPGVSNNFISSLFFFFFDFSMIIKLKTDHLIRPHDELNF